MKRTVPRFLNLDFVIDARRDPGALVSALGEKVLVLYTGRIGRTWRARLELNRVTRTPDAAIRGFCRLIKALPPVERELWNTAKSRDFNIGVETGSPPHNGEFVVLEWKR